jgi:hypothetical protein
MILDYFDEAVEEGDGCGHCDNCVHRGAEDALATTIRFKAQPMFKQGDRVRVPKLGRGTVAEVHDDRIAVRLASGETREFAPKFVVPVSSR